MADDDDRLPTERALYEDAACGLLLTSVDGRIRRVNRTFCRWVGRDADALGGRAKFQDLLTTGGRIFHQTHWAPLKNLSAAPSMELRLRRPRIRHRRRPPRCPRAARP